MSYRVGAAGQTPNPSLLAAQFMKSNLKVFQTKVLCAVALGFGLTFGLDAATFSDANWISMGGIPGANENIYATVVDSSSNLYIGGEFTIVGDVFATNVAKWNGSRWSALGPANFGFVHALAISEGDLYAAGTVLGTGDGSYVSKWTGSNWTTLGSGIN